MKRLITPFLLVILLSINCGLYAQWNLTGNSNATNTSIVGTTNAVNLNLATRNLTRMVIDSNGRVGIGTTSIPNIFSVKGNGGVPNSVWVNSGNPLFTGFGEQTVGNSDFILSMASTAFNARPVFIGRRAKGTLAAPAIVANNDFLMSFLASGYDGASFQNPAAIDFFVDGTPTAGNVPARISFVTGSNSATRAERLKIGNTGDITINTNQLFVQRTTGNVGIGTTTPLAKLDIAGTIKIADGSQGLGKVLTSDANGIATWATPTANPWIVGGNDITNNNSGNVGIGTTTPLAKLDIAGNIKITDGSQASGSVLTSDSTGLASWQSIPVVPETDPKVGSQTFGRVPKWNGSTLVDGGIIDNSSGNIGIGTQFPQARLDVKATNGYVAQFNGTSQQMYMGFYENDVYRGYLGSFSGAQSDMDFGTGTGNTRGKLHLTMQGNPKFTIDSAGQVGIGTTTPDASALMDLNSTSKGVLFPQVSIDSLKDVTSITNPANGLVVYNTTQPGVRNDMARGYYYYSANALSWVRLGDNLNDNPFQNGGQLGIQLRDKTKGVEMMDDYTGSSINWLPKVKILKMVDSALLNAKNNITALVLTGVNRKNTPGWEFRQKTSIIFENNYLTPTGSSGRGDNVAISAYTEATGTTQTSQTQGLAFYVTAPPQNTATADTPSISMFRHNVGIGTYVSDVNNVTEGRLQITGFSNGDQLSLRHPSSTNLKWGIYVSSIDSSLNFYSNGSLRANIDRVTGVYSALSDRNLKKNIETLKPVLPNIDKLIPYIYNYKDSKDGDRKAIGFMAQDVEPYFPDLVFDKKDRVTGEPFKMMTYQSFGVIAIKAIQEQQQQLAEKDAQLKALEEKTDNQQKQIDDLKAALLQLMAQKSPCTTSK